MKSGGKTVVYLSVGLACALSSRALTGTSGSGDTPYQAIVIRNIFDLKPIPPPPPPEQQVTPPPNVKLIGLMTLFGRSQGVFAVQVPLPGSPPTNYILGDDQRQASLEVRSINMADKSAQVFIDGALTTLKLEKAVAAAGPGPGPGMMGAGPGGRGPFMPGGGKLGARGGFGPGGQPGFAPASNYAPPSAPGTSYNPGYNPGVSPNAGASGLPTRQVRTDSGNDQPLTAEQQVIQIEAQREQYLNEGNPIAQILPPTPLTASLQAQRDAANQPAADTTAPTAPTTPQLPAFTRGRTTGTYALPPMPGQ